MKKIYFYAYDLDRPDLLRGWLETVAAINNGNEYIATTQMGLLSTDLFDLGYRICVDSSPDEAPFEIELGDKNKRTDREIRMGHNLFKMWKNGEFD